MARYDGSANLVEPVRTTEEARERGRNGGIASGKARKEKKILREAILKRLKQTDLDEIADGIITRAKKRRADAETFRDTVDGKPKETIEQDSTVEVTADVNLSIDEAREAFLAAFRDKCKD